MDKDIELQKIDIIENYFENELNSASSNTFNLLITLMAVLLTTYYGIVFNTSNVDRSQILPIGIGFIIGFFALSYVFDRFRARVRKRYDRDKFLTLVSDWHREIEKGHELPSLSEMKKQVIPKTEKNSRFSVRKHKS
jgi:hypothetical protein